MRLCICVTCIYQLDRSARFCIFSSGKIVFHSDNLFVLYIYLIKRGICICMWVTLGPLFCGVVRPTDYSPVAIKFLQKNMITMMMMMMMMMIKTMMIT